MVKGERMYLNSSRVWLAEDANNSDPDALIVKFLICDFSRNKNGVAINRKRINEWLDTLIHKPVVGKISVNSNGAEDFTSHNMTIETRIADDGNTESFVVFNTDAYGTFVDAAVEKINDIDCIVATAKIWKRYEEACEIIQRRINEGVLHTSWEIVIEEESSCLQQGEVTRIIDKGRFIGHCLLSENVEPAYDSSGVLSVAEKSQLNETTDNKCLVAAFLNAKTKGGENDMRKTSKDLESVAVQTSSADAGTVTAVSSEKEVNKGADTVAVSSLTDFDICEQIYKAMRDQGESKSGYIKYWFPVESYFVWSLYYPIGGSELNCLKINYTIQDDKVVLQSEETVTVSFDPIKPQQDYENSVKECETKDETIIALNEKVREYSEQLNTLKSEYEGLKAFKEQYDKDISEKAHMAEVEKIKEYALKSGVITEAELETSEEVKTSIDAVDYQTIKSIISDRVVASVIKSKEKDESHIQSASSGSPTICTSGGFHTSLESAETEEESGGISGKEASRIMREYFKG